MDPLQANNPTAAYIRKLSSQLQSLQKVVSELKKENADPSVLAERMPGKRVPYFANVSLDFTSGQLAARDGRTTITQDGHLIITGIMASCRVTDPAVAAELGRWRPSSSIESNLNGAGYGPIPMDFLWEVLDRNGDRGWQNEAVPSAYLFTAQGKPLYLPVGIWVDKNTTLTARVTPLRIENDCTLTFTFSGYKIINPTPYTY